MPRPSDEHMVKLKAAINRCRDRDVSAMFSLKVASPDLITLNALAKATGDTFTYRVTQGLLAAMKLGRSQS